MKKLLLVLIGLLFVANFALADTVISNPLSSNTFADLLNLVIDWIVNLALIITPLIITYGGIQFIAAGGNPGKAASARGLMFNAAIGLILALIAKTLVDVIKNLVVK